MATSSTRAKMALKIVRHKDVFALFGTHITCGDDPEIKNGKPAPDLFLAARQKFAPEGLPDAEKCLVFEDALNGIEAANRAGMPAVWVPGKLLEDWMSHATSTDCIGLLPDPNLRALERTEGFVEPVATINSLEDFDPVKFGLPPFTE